MGANPENLDITTGILLIVLNPVNPVQNGRSSLSLPGCPWPLLRVTANSNSVGIPVWKEGRSGGMNQDWKDL